jgi:hypothetical protein
LEQITFDGLKNTLLVVLAIAVAIYTLGKAIDTIRGWRKPKTDAEAGTNKTLADHQKMLDADKRRLDAHDEQISETRDMSRAMCQALNALLMHEITGNSAEKLRAAKDGIDAYLITTGGK